MDTRDQGFGWSSGFGLENLVLSDDSPRGKNRGSFAFKKVSFFAVTQSHPTLIHKTPAKLHAQAISRPS
jgi:hypothetical protein